VGHAVQPCRVGNLVTVGSSSGHCGDLPELSAWRLGLSANETRSPESSFPRCCRECRRSTKRALAGCHLRWISSVCAEVPINPAWSNTSAVVTPTPSGPIDPRARSAKSLPAGSRCKCTTVSVFM
jgi:hypothetical protein